jgi:chemotaxis protein MotA
MFAIVGIIMVFGCVIGGFLMEKGKLAVLIQPAELVTIGGAAIGTLLVANPMYILKKMVGGIMSILKGSPFTKQRYTETLKMMFDLFTKSRKEGAIAIESDVEDPEKSPIFSKYPAFLHDHHALAFVCDTMRMAITGGVNPFDVDQMMELDMDVHHHSANQPNQSLNTVADALPGLGIVAAVLGIVVTMGALGGPPEEIGHKVAAALVGTFLGILLCYGMLGPLPSWRWKSGAAQFLASLVLVLRKWRKRAERNPGRRLHPPHRPRPPWLTNNRLSSSRRRAATAATTAGPGRWRTPTLSLP